MNDLVDFEGHGLTRPHLGDLAEPSICSNALIQKLVTNRCGFHGWRFSFHGMLLPLIVGWVISDIVEVGEGYLWWYVWREDRVKYVLEEWEKSLDGIREAILTLAATDEAVAVWQNKHFQTLICSLYQVGDGPRRDLRLSKFTYGGAEWSGAQPRNSRLGKSDVSNHSRWAWLNSMRWKTLIHDQIMLVEQIALLYKLYSLVLNPSCPHKGNDKVETCITFLCFFPRLVKGTFQLE